MFTPEEEVFRSHFGQSATLAARAPGRVNLIGEHVDYLDGLVLPCAVDRHVVILARPSESGRCTVVPTGSPSHSPVTFDGRDLSRRENPGESWANYLIGVLAGYREKGIAVPPFDAAIFSTLPSGAGLSSSAALETTVALLAESLAGVSLDPMERALLCQEAEHDYAGVPCGIMDQCAVGLSRAGHALLLDCRDLTTRDVAFPPDLSILIADSGVKHALGDGEYRQRRDDCSEAIRRLGTGSLRDTSGTTVDENRDTLGDRLHRRCRHAISEMERVRSFVEALEANDHTAMATLLRASHDSLRDDYEVSCAELDLLVEAAYTFGTERGLAGARMTGGGFGGSTVNLVRSEDASALQDNLGRAFLDKTGRTLQSFVTPPAGGAHLFTH